jgi:MOSC domain-containing protein YiiM
MSQGTVVAICVTSRKGEPMASVQEAMAVAGQGLRGDRYARGQGSWSRGQVGRRQITLINALFVQGSGFEYVETRRNIATSGVELMDLIGQKFSVGDAMLRGVKYCDPCLRPSVLTNKPRRMAKRDLVKEQSRRAEQSRRCSSLMPDIPFRDAFHDRGGLVAEVLSSGLIHVGSAVVPPSKHYG